MAALLALLSSAMWGSADYLGGKLSRRRHVLVVLGGSQAIALLAMLVAAALTGSWSAPREYVGWAVLASVSGASGLLLYYRALAIGTMGVVSPIAALGVLVPLAVGLAQGDQPGVLQMFGIVLALVGVVAASGPEVHGDAGLLPALLAGGAALFLGLSMVAIARGSEASVVMTMTVMRLSTVSLLAVAVLVLHRAVRSGGSEIVSRADLPALAAVGLLDVGANLSFGLASTLGLLALVSVFGSLYPLATILLARYIDDERLRPIQKLGVGLALAGVAAISAG